MPSHDFQNINISTWTILRFFGIILGFAAIYVLSDIIASLVFAVIVASSIEPAIEWLKAHRIPRILGVIFIYLAILFVIFFVIYLIFPLLFDEVSNLAHVFPKIQDQFFSGIGQTPFLPFPPLVSENLESIIRIAAAYLGKLGGGVSEFASTVFGGIFSFILIVLFSFYLATQEKGIENFLRLIAPLKHEKYVIDLWQRSSRTLGKWFRVQMLLGAIVGVMIFFGLTFLGVRQAFVFALLAAMFEIIPVVGPIFAAIPAVAVAFLETPLLGMLTIALYVAVQQIESHVMIPVIMRKTVGLSPLLVVLAILVGGKIGGIFGILLAVPLTAILVEFLNDWDKKKRALVPE